MLRRTHDHHRDLRPLESAQGIGQTQPGGHLRDPARTGPHSGRSNRASVDGPSCAQCRQLRSEVFLQPSFQHEKPPRRAPILQRDHPPDMQRRRSNRSPHRPKIQFPIDQRLLAAGSFIHDFRTPLGARNSSGYRTLRRMSVLRMRSVITTARTIETRPNLRLPRSGGRAGERHWNTTTPSQYSPVLRAREIDLTCRSLNLHPFALDEVRVIIPTNLSPL
jgi:hypothetical protein